MTTGVEVVRRDADGDDEEIECFRGSTSPHDVWPGTYRIVLTRGDREGSWRRSEGRQRTDVRWRSNDLARNAGEAPGRLCPIVRSRRYGQFRRILFKDSGDRVRVEGFTDALANDDLLPELAICAERALFDSKFMDVLEVSICLLAAGILRNLRADCFV